LRESFIAHHVAMPGFYAFSEVVPFTIYLLPTTFHKSFVCFTYCFKRFAIFLLYAIFKVQVFEAGFSSFLLLKSLRTKQRLID